MTCTLKLGLYASPEPTIARFTNMLIIVNNFELVIRKLFEFDSAHVFQKNTGEHMNFNLIYDFKVTEWL